VINQHLPQAVALSNGTILVTTGLIAHTRTRDELLAVLAHEVAHVVADHSLQNHKKRSQAEAFSNALSGVAAIGTAYLAVRDGASGASAARAGLAVGIATRFTSQAVLEDLGAKWSQEQELEADQIAQRWLVATGHSTSALADMLQEMLNYSSAAGFAEQTSQYDTYPSLNERVYALKVSPAVERVDPDHDAAISDCLVHNAELRISAAKYAQAFPLLDRAIATGWVTGKPYLLKAIGLRHLGNDSETNLEIPALLTEALTDEWELPWVHGEMGLMHLRLGDTSSARDSFTLLNNNEAASERSRLWAQRMLNKIARTARQ